MTENATGKQLQKLELGKTLREITPLLLAGFFSNSQHPCRLHRRATTCCGLYGALPPRSRAEPTAFSERTGGSLARLSDGTANVTSPRDFQVESTCNSSRLEPRETPALLLAFLLHERCRCQDPAITLPASDAPKAAVLFPPIPKPVRRLRLEGRVGRCFRGRNGQGRCGEDAAVPGRKEPLCGVTLAQACGHRCFFGVHGSDRGGKCARGRGRARRLARTGRSPRNSPRRS